MAYIYDLIKEQETYRADVSQTVLELAQAMVDRNIGAVPVLSEGELVGIFSEPDLMRRGVAAALDPAATRVGEVITNDPLPAAPNEEEEPCMRLMARPES